MKKPKLIDFGPFPIQLLYYEGFSSSEVLADLDKKGIDMSEKEKEAFGLLLKSPERGGLNVQFIDSTVTMIWLRNVPNTPKSIGTLAHEASHVADHIFESLNIRPDKETKAYLIGYTVEKVMEFGCVGKKRDK